jgi:carbon storage regulator CsrA
MLVITRSPGESILIGGIEVTVLSAVNSDGEVRLGVEAPRSLSVVRVDGVVQLDGVDEDTPPSLRQRS